MQTVSQSDSLKKKKMGLETGCGHPWKTQPAPLSCLNVKYIPESCYDN